MCCTSLSFACYVGVNMCYLVFVCSCCRYHCYCYTNCVLDKTEGKVNIELALSYCYCVQEQKYYHHIKRRRMRYTVTVDRFDSKIYKFTL